MPFSLTNKLALLYSAFSLLNKPALPQIGGWGANPTSHTLMNPYS